MYHTRSTNWRPPTRYDGSLHSYIFGCCCCSWLIVAPRTVAGPRPLHVLMLPQQSLAGCDSQTLLYTIFLELFDYWIISRNGIIDFVKRTIIIINITENVVLSSSCCITWCLAWVCPWGTEGWWPGQPCPASGTNQCLPSLVTPKNPTVVKYLSSSHTILHISKKQLEDLYCHTMWVAYTSTTPSQHSQTLLPPACQGV